MLEEIDKESKPRTPRKIGDLRNRTIKVVQGMKGSIHWKVPYAARQENTQFRNYTTPGTGPHFAENAVRSVVARAASIFGRMKV